MASFTEFRNSFPESSNEKGERFEIFLSEWMFKNHPVLSSQFKKVWRFSEWPKAWSQKDLGTDLIAEDQHGKICAIQAKFYKEKNSIPKSHIDSFLSDSNRPEVDYRYLIATTDNLGANAIKTIEGQEKPVHTFMLQQFNEEFEWPKSIDSLETYQLRKPHQPRPHQKAAIDDVCAKLGKRGQLLMACGTGKTLTGQRIAESLGSNTTLVLLPSLLLLSKTVADWVSEKEQDFIYLPVCSDKSVTKKTDEITLGSHELPFQSTTDSSEIAAFLRRPENKVIFSTYQSSPQIAEAFRAKSLKPFDLIIADEAHRCAGRVSSDYSTVLSEDLIPAQKRLFMTATPRTYSSRLQKSAMDAEIQVASMDDEEVFGPVLHHLTFGQAIENNPPLLTDYKVVVVGVNDALVREQVEERAFVKTEGGLEDDARSLAIQIGLSKAIKDYDLKRVISFHGRVKYASDFAGSFLKLQEDLKPESKPNGKIEYGYVSGSMPTSQRTRELRALGELANEDRYIVGNARCLSEGVDVPALDGVAFVDPKRSEIDIVQAVGRAIRLAEGKSFGTIVIPVFISDQDDPDEVLSTSEFDQVWKVVNALRSHDESLGETLDEMRVSLGRQSKISLSGTKIIFDLPIGIGNRFTEAFQTKLVETTTSNWEFWYGLIQNYIEREGDALVPKDHIEGRHRLGNWVSDQRTLADKMPEARRAKLEALNGWAWNKYEADWNKGIGHLTAFFARTGHSDVSYDQIVDGFKLGRWSITVRRRKDNGQLSAEQIRDLEALNFSWSLREKKWAAGVRALKIFVSQNGHAAVPREHDEDGFPLGAWVVKHRQRQNILSIERRQELLELGFIFSPHEARWLKSFQLLKDYKKKTGSAEPPRNYVEDGVNLGTWVANQKQKKKRGNLKREYEQLLEGIGFIWGDFKDHGTPTKSLESNWAHFFALLKSYQQTTGKIDVPRDFMVEGKNLGIWVQSQRSKRNKGKLNKEREKLLEGIDFIWDLKAYRWNRCLEALKAFQRQHGTIIIPDGYKTEDGFNLSSWVRHQRYPQHPLTEEKKAKLEAVPGWHW